MVRERCFWRLSSVGPGLLLLVLCCFSRVAESAADLRIARDGGTGTIVIPDGDWVDPAEWAKKPQDAIQVHNAGKNHFVYLGARLVQEYVKKITGRELAVVAETEWERQGKPEAVSVGPTRLAVKQFGARLNPANLKRSGYVINSLPGRLLICGVDAWGSYSGCAAFLEEYCGVQWLWPTELGEEVPAVPELVFDRLDVTFQPAIAFLASGLNQEGNAWAVRNGMRPLEWEVHHSLGPEIFHAGYATRPEWFSLLDGERFVPPATNNVFNWQPCMSSPAVIERALTMARRHFRDHPRSSSFSMGTNDGVWRGCECESCRALDGPSDPRFDLAPYHYNGRYSRRYFFLVSQTANALQEEFPGKRVGAWAYAGEDVPPADAQRNVHVAVNVIGTKLAWLNPELRKWEELRLERWSRVAGHLMTYDYMYQTGYIPMYTPHLHADIVRTLQRQSVTSYYAEWYPTIARSGPRYWVHLKMCLDPSQNLEALLDRWLRGMFKEAAPPMQEFYDTIEKAWSRYPYHERNTDGWGTYCFTGGVPLAILTPDDVARLDTCMDKADALAVDAKAKARLAVIRSNYVATRACARVLWRQRPYVDPVPFDDAVVMQELAEHVRGEAVFDAVADYEKNGKPDPLSWVYRGSIAAIDTPAKRLGRVVDGLVDKPLADAALNPPPAPAAVRETIAKRVAHFAESARASAEQKTMLTTLAAKVVFVEKTDSTPVLDGQATDACWQKLPVYEGFQVSAEKGKAVFAPASYATSFKICHDNRQLYVAVTCHQAPGSIVAKAKDRTDPALAKDDRIVLTLNPWQFKYRGGSGRLTLTVAAGGVVVEDGAGYGATYWQAGTRAAARIADDGYVLEIAVPFKAFLFSPQQASRLQFNVQRFVVGATPETSAWFPAEAGTTFAWPLQADARQLLQDSVKPTTLALSGTEITEPLAAGGWEPYVLEAPATVRFADQAGAAAAITGKHLLLVGKRWLEVLPGHEYAIEATYGGPGTVLPALGWYQRGGSGVEDVLEVVKESEPLTEIGPDKLKRVQILLQAPVKADAARFRLNCRGDVQVMTARLIPRPLLQFRVDLDTAADRLITGHVFGLQASVCNVTAKPIAGLTVRLAYPHGVDLRAEAVAASATLNPGESTRALWWLTPVYAVGQADFVLVAEGKGLPQTVVRVRGPLPAFP